METGARIFGDVSGSAWRSDIEERSSTLDHLLAANAAIAKRKALYPTERDRLEAAMMRHPISNEKTYAAFGLLLGSLPPASIFLRVLGYASDIRPEQFWIVALLLLVNTGAALTGFFTGKFVGRSMNYLYALSFSKRLPLLVLIGLTWGIIAGAGGGVFFFVFGALFGAMIGGIVGAAALPIFAILHNFLRAGEVVDRRHFLPLAFGITLTICAFILGLY